MTCITAITPNNYSPKAANDRAHNVLFSSYVDDRYTFPVSTFVNLYCDVSDCTAMLFSKSLQA